MTIFRQRFLAFALAMLLLVLLLPMDVSANAAEPPCLTVVVVNAPDDLEITLHHTDGTEIEALRLFQFYRSWETYYRFYYDHTAPYEKVDLQNIVLTASTAADSFDCIISAGSIKSYNNLFLLDLDNQTLTDGLYPGRYAIIVTIRVLTTLIMEGVIFALFGYTEKKSWIRFIIINLLTQAGVNIALAGVSWDSYALLAYILVEIFVILTELLAFPSAVRERGTIRAIVYALVANLISLYVGGLLISYMPV